VFPHFSELRDLERQTLTVIDQMGEFGRIGPLQTAARRASSDFNHIRGPVNFHLGFTLDIRLRGDRGAKPFPRRIDIGVLVQSASDKVHVGNASYSLLICRKADPTTSPIVRKVHFDYESEELRNQGEPKPSVHLQMCGKFSAHHVAAGYSESRLAGMYPSWEKPRIPVPPTSLALLLNWLLLEFQSDAAAQAILRNPTWRNLVAKAERVVLVPYFKGASNFLESTADKGKRFLQTHLYEMQVD
jgi:hypothetical protein